MVGEVSGSFVVSVFDVLGRSCFETDEEVAPLLLLLEAPALLTLLTSPYTAKKTARPAHTINDPMALFGTNDLDLLESCDSL